MKRCHNINLIIIINGRGHNDIDSRRSLWFQTSRRLICRTQA